MMQPTHLDKSLIRETLGFRVVVILCILALLGTGCEPKDAVPGASGIGDTYFHQLGNSGYDVHQYAIVLEVDPVKNLVHGTTQIKAKAAQSLSSLNLDFHGMTIDDILVNSERATYSRQEDELTVVPRRALVKGTAFSVSVHYHGNPEPETIITSESNFHQVGWFHSAEGAINVMSEPNGAETWYPVNDHPRDKATYRFEITVPKPWVVAATGTLVQTVDKGDRTCFVWEMDKPMASYLASINIDQYTLETAQGPGGLKIRNYIPPGFPDTIRKGIDQIPEMMQYFEGIFGPYPFDEYGVVIADKDIVQCHANFGGAYEAQSMSVHCPKWDTMEESIIAHELAHQWFGDSVSLKNWQDLWLKEGLATYAEWLWNTRDQDLIGLNDYVKEQLKSYQPQTKVDQPPAEDLYQWEVYMGGALTAHALRLKVGDEVFFKILRTYLERYQYGNASTDDFIAVAEEVSKQELSPFFASWLDQTVLPELPGQKY
jgi:aminopeptidase N